MPGICSAGGGQRLPPAVLPSELERGSVFPSDLEHSSDGRGERDGNRRRGRPGCFAELPVLFVQDREHGALVDRVPAPHAQSGSGDQDPDRAWFPEDLHLPA